MKRLPHPRGVPRKPEGQPTRGKTASNRLRRVDHFLARYDPALVRRADGPFDRALFVDLGYGAGPYTTLESAARLRALDPALPVLGVEIDPERVATARPYADALTDFRLGGFNLPLREGEHVKLIRAFNVLRQYDEAGFAPACERLAEFVLPGGLLIEGTSDPYGRLWSANVFRREAGGWRAEALVFSTNFRHGFDPVLFQAVLPKNYIHRVVPGEPIHAFFSAWKQAAAATSPHRAWGMRQWFSAAAGELAQRGFRMDPARGWLSKGYLIWEQ